MRLWAVFLGVLCVFSASAAAAQPRTLTMNGEGVVTAVPDRVELSAGVATEAATAAAALAANSQRMNSVFAALEKLGVPAQNIRTQNFSVSPQYAEGPARRLTGYAVSNEIHVLLDDTARLGATLDALVDAGANQMYGLNYGLRDDAMLASRARAAAVADARAKAQDYAAAAGLTLGPILTLSESDGGAPVPMFKVMAAPARAPVPVAAGEQAVSAHVSIIWEIH